MTKDNQTKDEASSNQEKKPRFNTFIIDGVKYRTQLTEKFKKRKKYEIPDDKKVFSDIPGTILKICAKEGDKVKEGDQILILEAMKMKNKILFSRDGVVKKIYVEENQKVPKGKLMVELK